MLTSLHFTETMRQQLTTYVHTLCTVHGKHDFALTLSQKDNPNLYLKVSEKTPVCKRPYRHGLCWGGKGWFNHVSVSRHSFKNHRLLLCFGFYSVSRTPISTFGLPVSLPFPSSPVTISIFVLCAPMFSFLPLPVFLFIYAFFCFPIVSLVPSCMKGVHLSSCFNWLLSLSIGIIIVLPFSIHLPVSLLLL